MILNNLLALLLQFFIPLFQHSLTIYLYINLFTLWIKSTFLIIFKLKVSKNKEIINDTEIEEMQDLRELGIVPLAIPLLSGPGAISTSIIHAKSFSSPLHWVGAISSVILIGILVRFILAYSKRIGEKLGTIGQNVMTRIMGIILLAISIEMIIGGIKEILPILKGI